MFELLAHQTDERAGAICDEEVKNANECTRPNDPLRVLGEFLLQKSRDIEGT